MKTIIALVFLATMSCHPLAGEAQTPDPRPQDYKEKVDRFRNVQDGVSTESSLVKWFDEPHTQFIEKGKPRKLTWTFAYDEPTDRAESTLTVWVDSTGKVLDHAESHAGHGKTCPRPKPPTVAEVDERLQSIEFVKKGETTQEMLLKWLGSPQKRAFSETGVRMTWTWENDLEDGRRRTATITALVGLDEVVSKCDLTTLITTTRSF